MNTQHFHDVYEIYYMNAGTRNYFINDANHPVSEGNLVLIKPYDLHKTMDTGIGHSRVLINFNREFLPFHQIDEIIEACFSTSKVLSFDFAMQNHIDELVRKMIIEADSQKVHFYPRLQSQMVELLIEIARYLKENQKADANITPANQKIYEIIQFLKANYDRNLSLEDLSHEIFISQYYMTRLFKKTTGFTIIEYIHSLRIIEAQRLLKETSKKVIDIAQTVGFSNISNFGKVFKALTGISPLSYRKMNR